MRDVSKIRLKVSRKLFSEWMAAMPEDVVANRQDCVELSGLLIDWQHMMRHQERWERVRELRSQFGKAKRVSDIWRIVAKETDTTSGAVDKSCKDVERLKKRIEGCVARLNGKLRPTED